MSDITTKKPSEKYPASIYNLGINTGTAARLQPRGFQSIEVFEKIDRETGEIITFRKTKNGDKINKTAQESRAERYALKTVVNSIFPKSRTAKCCRTRRSADPVTVCKSGEHKRAFYAGLVVCGSPWWCPVCAAKISERRRVELESAIATAKAMGLAVALATFTVPHGLGDDLSEILDRMQAAWRHMTMSRGYKEMRRMLGLVGTIRATEVTHGDKNGFHPHYHVLMFFRHDQPQHVPATSELFLGCLWRTACTKRGLPEPSKERGVKVDDGSWAARYASKWGLENEMTKSHLKTSKGINGLTPWDFLRAVFSENCEKSRQLFTVYANSFKGRRQLYWSNGLREFFAMDNDLTDEEIAAVQDDLTAYELANLTDQQWRAILKTRSEAAVLDLAERDPSRLLEFIECLVGNVTKKPKTSKKIKKLFSV